MSERTFYSSSGIGSLTFVICKNVTFGQGCLALSSFPIRLYSYPCTVEANSMAWALKSDDLSSKPRFPILQCVPVSQLLPFSLLQLLI